jgi:hypothetical protein
MRKLAVTAFVLSLVLSAASATAGMLETVEVSPSKDNTLYESPDGSLSNGAGSRMFAGVTAQPNIRRGLVAFDVATHVPPGATIANVTLTLEQVMTIAGDTTVSLHRAEQDWGEGASTAAGQQGAGGVSATGDATWLHTSYDTDFWTTPGGEFVASPSASQVVGGFGSFSWSSAGMIADVQAWLDDPASDFGWVIVGDESTAVTAKTFSTRESDTNPPVLLIEFEPPDGNNVPAVSTWGALALALAMLALATAAVRRRQPRAQSRLAEMHSTRSANTRPSP